MGNDLQVRTPEPRTYGLNLCASPLACSAPRKQRTKPAQTPKPEPLRAPESPTITLGAPYFAIGKRLRNLPELRQVGFQANRRLLATQRLGYDPIAAARTLQQVTDPVTVGDSRVAGLRFGDRRAMALLSLLTVFRLSVRGFTNRDLRSHLAPLLGLLPGAMTAGQATYDLRRLRTHGLIQRIPHTNRYLPTEDGLRAAIVLTQTHTRLLSPALAAATDPLADFPHLHRTLDNVQTALDEYAERQGLAA